MRILVLSDSHSHSEKLIEAIAAQPEARHVFFLGDNVRDIDRAAELFQDRVFHVVCGNCDICAVDPAESLCELGGIRIFFCHGHTYSVKGGTGCLRAAAKRAGAQLALFGHTHAAVTEYENGIYLVNPGSVSRPRNGPASYAAIDLVGSGIMPIIISF